VLLARLPAPLKPAAMPLSQPYISMSPSPNNVLQQTPSRDEAIAWAARIAKACRCDQELRVFEFDPQS
jgi:hypothetical protein